MKKHWMMVLVALAALFAAAGCGEKPKPGNEGAKPSVLPWNGTDSPRAASGTEAPVREKPAVVKTESGSVNRDNPIATLCGVTLDIVPAMLADGPLNISVSKLADTTENGVRCENYELDVGTHDRFDVPIEVTFPCTVSADTDPAVEHYNEETGAWDSLICFKDEAKGTVSAYFGSFSEARVSYLPVGLNPKIFMVCTDPDNPFAPQIGVAAGYWEILQHINPAVYGDEVIKFRDDPANYAVELPKLDPNMTADAAYQAFTKVNTLWTFCDPMINIGIASLPQESQSRVVKFMIDNSESLGNAMNAVPFIMMGTQLAFDLHNGDQESAAVNLFKNMITSSGTIYSLATGYSHLGFTLSFFGVALFGMELDYFIDAAKAEQAANVKAVFDTYYGKTEPLDAHHWYKVFENAYWKNDGNADKAMRAVKDAVDAYCNKFWVEVYNEGLEAFWETLGDSEYRKMFMHATPEQKKALTEQQKARVWNLIEKKSMKIIQRFLIEQLQDNTRKKLHSFTEPYNKPRSLTIRETVPPEGAARLTGYTLCLGTQGVPFPDWHVNIPEDEELREGWMTFFDFTVYGYLKMGMPNQVLFYKDEEDFRAGKKPEYSFNFEPDGPITLVDINFGNMNPALEPFMGDWSRGTQPENIVNLKLSHTNDRVAVVVINAEGPTTYICRYQVGPRGLECINSHLPGGGISCSLHGDELVIDTFDGDTYGYERGARKAASPDPFFGDWVDAGGERFQLWLGKMGKYVSLVMNDLSMSPDYTIEGKSFSFKETLLYGGTITLTLQDDGSLRMTGAAGNRTLVKKHREE